MGDDSPTARPRVALVHALVESIAPLNAAMAREWPECERMNLLDDSLSADLARSPHGLDEAMHERFLRLADYAVAAGANGILFSCSAFGPSIERVARRYPEIPVLKPYEAMLLDAARLPRPVALLATFEPTLRSMVPEFPDPAGVRPVYVDGAFAALQRGETGRHDDLIAIAVERAFAEGCAAVALAQFSMSHLAAPLQAHFRRPVLSSVASAVAAMRERVMEKLP